MVEQQDVKAPPKSKTPDPGATSFTANGNKYTMCPLTIRRHEEYEILGVELGLDMSFEKVHDQHVKLLDLLNRMAQQQHVLGEMAVIVNDLVTGGFLRKMSNRHAALKMCALFLNREGEDASVITDEMIDAKIADWEKEGIEMNYFFGLAYHTIPGWILAYKASSRATSGSVVGQQSPNGKTDTKGSSSASAGTTHAPKSSA